MDSQTVSKIAYLSRLNNQPDQEFLDKYGSELSDVLDYVAELKQVDTSSVTNMLGSANIVSLSDLAEDEPDISETDYQRIRQNIINNFPDRQGDLLLLPGIFEN